MKVGIIGGAGLLGSTMVFCIAQKNIVDEIVLIDVKENVARAHVMDMEQAISEYNPTNIMYGKWDALEKCDIAIMTASMPERPVKSRIEYLENNMPIVKTVAEHIKQYCPNAAIINGTNPVDPFDYILYDITGMPARQFIGFSRNDSLRLRWAIAKLLGVQTYDVQALVIGEHGEAQVPLYSSVKVKGEPVILSREQKIQVDQMVKNWFVNYQALQSGRTSGWTSGLAVAYLVEAMVKRTGEVLACSAILNGEYGITGVSLGVPVVLGPKGIEKIVEMPLAEEENEGLKIAAEKMADVLKGIHWK